MASGSEKSEIPVPNILGEMVTISSSIKFFWANNELINAPPAKTTWEYPSFSKSLRMAAGALDVNTKFDQRDCRCLLRVKITFFRPDSGLPMGTMAVRLKFDSAIQPAQLPSGANGAVAIYTDSGKPLRIIRKVVIRMFTWLNFMP